MTSKCLYQVVLFLAVYCYSFSAKGQLIKVTFQQSFYDNIWQVERSLLKKEDSANVIIYSIAGYKDLFLIKNSVHWKGYIIRNTEGPVPEPYVMDSNGDTLHKPVRTVLYHFNGDSLYSFLLGNNIYSLKQFSDDEIADMYTKRRTRRKDIKYAFAHSSHESYVTIMILPSKNKAVTYPMSFIDNKELHFIPALRTFFLLGQVLKDY